MERRRSTIRTAVVWDALDTVLQAQHAALGGSRPLQVIDLGGGTGGFAVRIAALGHCVVVVDPSPDALASLERRVADSHVPSVRGMLGDADTLLDVVEPGSADVVLCHGLLEVVEKPAGALEGVATALVNGGALSVVAAQKSAAVFSRALAGHIAEARVLLDDPAGRASGGSGRSELGGRRFNQTELRALLTRAGFTISDVRGIRIFTDHISSTVVDSEPGAAEDLRALEASASTHPEFMAIASQLHLLATKG